MKVYEFHEILLWETHMSYSEIRSHCLWYFTNCENEKCFPFLCRCFTLKDDYAVLKFYEFLGLAFGLVLGLVLGLELGLGLGLVLGFRVKVSVSVRG